MASASPPIDSSTPLQAPSQGWGEWLYSIAADIAAKIERFVSRHFALLSFFSSCAVLMLGSPVSFVLGSIAGAALHYYLSPALTVDLSQERVVTVAHASVAIVGAVATAVAFTPSGRAAGFVFRAIPFLSSLASGSASYRAFAAYIR